MWYRAKSFFLFYFRALTKYNIHSPFIYDFITNVLDTSKNYYVFGAIENMRERLASDQNTIHVTDFGAGSTLHHGENRKISAIAKASVSDTIKCRILFNLVNHYQFKSILELGTSLGISSSYLAAANSKSKVLTLEGDKNISAIASEVHKLLELKNISLITGHFEQTLPTVLNTMPQIDLAFIDGHHAKLPTIQYFESIIKHCHNDSIIIIDDIYWSPEMTEAWHLIQSHKAVTLTIDLFDIGVVFLKKELSCQALSFISFKYKPWQIGLFS